MEYGLAGRLKTSGALAFFTELPRRFRRFVPCSEKKYILKIRGTTVPRQCVHSRLVIT